MHSHICSQRLYRCITRLTPSVLALGLQHRCPVVCVKYERCCESEQSCVRETEKQSPSPVSALAAASADGCPLSTHSL